MKVTDAIKYVGVNDHQVDLFEGQYPVPRGMAYNSYLVKDEKTLVFDSVDRRFGEVWLENIKKEIGDRNVDFLVVQHMEPDHSSSIALFAEAYPSATIVASASAFAMMKNYFGDDFSNRRLVIKEGDVLSTGVHEFSFIAAPMVHWPEVMVTYEKTNKILFSADAFGTFGANDIIAPQCWQHEARRYYIGIVGKFGTFVQALLRKAASLEIALICPLHGPVLFTKETIAHAIESYSKWSSYVPEESGICIAYSSVYGHTREAVFALRDLLTEKGARVVVHDLAREDQAVAVADAFRFDKVVLATTTYNTQIFPWMHHFIEHLTERQFKNRKIGLIENGSWAPSAAKVMKTLLSSSTGLEFCESIVTIKGALDASSKSALEALANELLV